MNASTPGRKTPRFLMIDGAHGLDLPKPKGCPAPAPSHVQLDGEIRDGSHRMMVRIYYEDTDFSGIVYHANYLRFIERGRSNYLRLLGADQRALFADGSGAPGYAFVVRAMQLEFLKSARMDDVIEVVTTPLEVKGASITMGQQIHSRRECPARSQGQDRLCHRRAAAPDPEKYPDRDGGRSCRPKFPVFNRHRADITFGGKALMLIAVASQNFWTVTAHAGKSRRFLVFKVAPCRAPLKSIGWICRRN